MGHLVEDHLGTLAALRQNSPTDYGIMGVAVLGIALPSFVTGPLFALVFGLYLRWLPVAGWETGQLRYLVLPVVTLALPVIAYIAGMTAPAGKKMGHAGAIITGNKGTAKAKREALTAAGAFVANNPTEIGGLVKKALG